MQYTTNYSLNKPNYSDQYDLRHWNDNMDLIDAQMKNEETARIQSDTTLQVHIDEEALARQNADTTLQSNITSEANTRAANDTTIQNNLNSEVTARTNADTQIRTDLGNGNLVADKANKDKDGNQIDTTYQKKSYKVSSWSSTPDNDNYPTEKLVKDNLDGKVSQIKINGNAISMASDKSVNIQTSFKIQDSKGNTGAAVNMSNGEITIKLPSTIYGAVFN